MIGRGTSRAIGAARHFTFGEWFAGLPGNRYSRRVALLKIALPAIGLTLLLLVIAWPRLAPLFDRLRFAAIDLREARELRMINPRYAGTDREGHPMVITAAVGRQVPQHDDLLALDQPRADLKSHNGANVVITSNSGVYQSQTQFLDMFGDVTLNHENGTKIVTATARLDAANNAAEGHDPVEGHGPSGDVTSQGFQVIDRGDIIIFTGQSDLLLKGSKSDAAPTAAPADVPAPVAQAAAQIEAKVDTKPKADIKPAPVPAAHSAPAKHPAPPPHQTATKAPAQPKPAAKKPG
jgi:lipopolysaccharide export system protein LptC